jgi:hypothetical protein
MRNILEEIDICKLNKIEKPNLPLWVYGTLRSGGRFHFYLVDCSFPVGCYRMAGTLMQMVSGDVFVKKYKAEDAQTKPESDRFAMGELYSVSLAGLWRIFHLENQSGTFPKAYDLDVSEVVGAESQEKKIALWFRRREEEPLGCQDFSTHKTLLEKLVEFFEESGENLSQDGIDDFLRTQLAKA